MHPEVDPADAIRQLKAAMRSGELSVSYAGRSVTFRNITELLQSLEYFEREAARAAGAGPARITYVRVRA